jgi:hypothetical protein
MPLVHFVLVVLEIGSHELFAQAGLPTSILPISASQAPTGAQLDFLVEAGGREQERVHSLVHNKMKLFF